jgi:2-(3-amino-3-carboxypropyl)histidine synthase
MYDFETERVAGEIRSRGARRVLAQLPDGLRPYAFDLVESLSKETGAEVILSGDSCYGACDLASRQTSELDADLLVHYGHTPFVETDIPVLYVEARIPVDVAALVKAALPLMDGWRCVALATTVQHAHQLGEVADALRAAGKEPYTGKGGGKTPLDGQVLGCMYAAATAVPAEVDGFLFVGGGNFHPLGLALSSGKPVVIANPYNGTVTPLGDSELMQLAKRRAAAIAYAKNAKRIGILVSSKPGQAAMEMARGVRDKLNARGISAFLIYLDEVKPQTLENFSEADAFVDTACPRIALDGVPGVARPILTLPEVSVLTGDRTWEDLWSRGYLA